METFTPIAMKCTQEQFEAVKPKLEKIGKIGYLISAFETYDYITNNYGDEVNYFDFVTIDKERWGFQLSKFYHEWNEEIFLKACGIKVDTLQEQLEKAEAEVKRLKEAIEEENKTKVGDWVYIEITKCFFKVKDNDVNYLDNRHRKITNTELIKLLEQEIK